MSLINRLIHTEEPRIPAHTFMAAIHEYTGGFISKNQIVSGLGLSPAEGTDLQEFVDSVDGDLITFDDVHAVLILAQAGFYNKTTVKSRLGLTAG